MPPLNRVHRFVELFDRTMKLSELHPSIAKLYWLLRLHGLAVIPVILTALPTVSL